MVDAYVTPFHQWSLWKLTKVKMKIEIAREAK
jgi:hypothetical protein